MQPLADQNDWLSISLGACRLPAVFADLAAVMGIDHSLWQPDFLIFDRYR
jgi:hypothetical protein